MSTGLLYEFRYRIPKLIILETTCSIFNLDPPTIIFYIKRIQKYILGKSGEKEFLNLEFGAFSVFQ